MIEVLTSLMFVMLFGTAIKTVLLVLGMLVFNLLDTPLSKPNLAALQLSRRDRIKTKGN